MDEYARICAGDVCLHYITLEIVEAGSQTFLSIQRPDGFSGRLEEQWEPLRGRSFREPRFSERTGAMRWRDFEFEFEMGES